jgi:hypothetical protein
MVLAFVRWRGNRAALLTTVYDQGRSRQVQLANLRDAYVVPPEVRATVASRFPHIHVDWDAVEHALAAGPPAERVQAADIPNDRLQWLETEQRLRHWAARAEPRHRAHAAQLRAAADVLALWRAGKPDFPIAQALPGADPEGMDAQATSTDPLPLPAR